MPSFPYHICTDKHPASAHAQCITIQEHVISALRILFFLRCLAATRKAERGETDGECGTRCPSVVKLWGPRYICWPVIWLPHFALDSLIVLLLRLFCRDWPQLIPFFVILYQSEEVLISARAWMNIKSHSGCFPWVTYPHLWNETLFSHQLIMDSLKKE